MRNYCIGILAFLLSCSYTFAQKEDTENAFQLNSVVPDVLEWNGLQYLMLRQPLAFFEGFTAVYPELKKQWDVTPIYGDPGLSQNYYPLWVLHDSTFYLRDIGFYEDSTYIQEKLPNNEAYKRMENLTGRKFKKGLSKSISPQSPFGSIRADWVDGVICVKLSPIEFLKEAHTKLEKKYGAQWGDFVYNEWERIAYQQLTFKNGKLISITNIQPIIEPRKKDSVDSKPINLFIPTDRFKIE